MATGYDYTQEPIQNSQDHGAAEDTFNPDDYSFLPLATTPDIEAAEARGFRDIEPGDHELVVAGFVGRPVENRRTGFVAGRQVGWTSAMVKVRLAKASDPQATIIDQFDLPPRDPAEQDAYLNATKNSTGGSPGFMAAKFGQFISRIGFPFAAGAPLPAEACRLSNWIGRHVHATVDVEKAGKDGPRINAQTGMAYPPRTQVKLFSYRPAAPAGGTATAQHAAPRQVAQAGRQAAPAPAPTRQAAYAASASPLDDNGLGDI